ARPAGPGSRASRRRGLALFMGQLAMNALWTWLFFAWRQGAVAFGEIAVLWLVVLTTAWHFGRVRPLAAWLLLPYLSWLGFATALTWAVWQRNPGYL
ncbi:MAG TPA: TspO/MBR family protein, partial [Gemmatimonadales bacterium]